MNESEWWNEYNDPLFVYYSTWDDLEKKLKGDVSKKTENIKKFMEKHRNDQMCKINLLLLS